MTCFARHIVWLFLPFAWLCAAAIGAEMTQPVALVRTAPSYPTEMRRERIGGNVVVEFIVATDGSVKQVTVVRSTRREFERAAVRAINLWRFKPGTIDGRPVNVLASQTLEFSCPRVWVQPFELLRAGKSESVTLDYWQDAQGRLQRVELVGRGSAPAVAAAHAILADEVAYDPDPPAPVGIQHRATYVFGVDELPKSAREILKQLETQDPAFARASDLDRPVAFRSRDDAVFPMKLRETDSAGEATIEFFIDRQGVAQLPRVLSASKEEYGFAAAQAVGQWRFDPPLRHGKPVVVRVRVPIEFRLASKP